MSRHEWDFYESPHWYTTDLLRHIALSGVIGEPCVGGGAIASILQMLDVELWTNDLDPRKGAGFHSDATDPVAWMKFPDTDWVVTNPPFSDAAEIVKLAYNKARKGVVMFLRQTFLEPCENRAEFLDRFPPTLTLVFPRYKFRRGESGGWQTDSATISAFVWEKGATSQKTIVRPKSDIWGFHDNPENAPPQEKVMAIVARTISERKTDGVTALNICQLQLDGGTQCREKLDFGHVNKLTEAIEDGVELDPIEVFHDGTNYWLVDGFHRVAAHRQADRYDILAIVKLGTLRDAQLRSAEVNAENKAALPRTRADARRAVLKLLQDSEWSQWSNAEIARRCKVSDKTVAKCRSELTPEFQSEERKIVDRYGNERTLNTASIGKRKPPPTFEVGDVVRTVQKAPMEFEGAVVCIDAPEGLWGGKKVTPDRPLLFNGIRHAAIESRYLEKADDLSFLSPQERIEALQSEYQAIADDNPVLAKKLQKRIESIGGIIPKVEVVEVYHRPTSRYGRVVGYKVDRSGTSCAVVEFSPGGKTLCPFGELGETPADDDGQGSLGLELGDDREPPDPDDLPELRRLEMAIEKRLERVSQKEREQLLDRFFPGAGARISRLQKELDELRSSVRGVA